LGFVTKTGDSVNRLICKQHSHVIVQSYLDLVQARDL